VRHIVFLHRSYRPPAAVYGITHNIASNPAATQSVYESLGQDFSNLDLQQFFKTFGVPSQVWFSVLRRDAFDK
jgi:hypothetical protein